MVTKFLGKSIVPTTVDYITIGSDCFQRDGTSTTFPTTITSGPFTGATFASCTDCEVVPNDCFDNPLACGGDPSLELRITADDVDLPITWCGKTWVKSTETPGANEALSGQGQCVCPTFHVKSVGYTRSSNYEYWRFDPSLRLERFINAGGAGANVLQINAGAGAVNSYYWHYFTLGNTSSTNAGTGNGGFPPQQAQSIITNATSKYKGYLQDGYFLVSYTLSGALFEWSKGERW